MALRDIGLLWQLARRIENVFDGVQNATRGLEKLRDDLRELEKRVAKLEGGEELLIERARSSAAVAASGGGNPTSGGNVAPDRRTRGTEQRPQPTGIGWHRAMPSAPSIGAICHCPA
jgi:hypothetical protein